ncbi:FtsK/SpoIIIE domain-containing protein [Diaminobutyricimonas sp. LJ205]|uniref:FtsK/SpoIIIE domain-containing protein n=1 Tax=Diaminobutyricimonas sp. LJ205 TaxID=2683590 RepID=UPI0012F4F193|nr:FtsK/SpoIIIE domain-containing protein [Diaminobutyricimonas sp. LJ205]
MSDPGIRLPAPPAGSEPAPFPMLATVAPVVGSIALWVITQSPFALLFAVLGPVTAIATLGDGAVSTRRRRRREQRRFASELAATLTGIDEAHDQERRRRWAATPGIDPLLRGDPIASTGARGTGPIEVVIGEGSTPSELRIIDAGVGTGTADPATALAAAREKAAVLERAPIVVDAAAGIAVIGPAPVSRAVAAAIALQLLAIAREDARVRYDPDWFDWLGLSVDEPAARGELTVSAAATVGRLVVAEVIDVLPADCGVILTVARGGLATLDGLPVRPSLVSREQARLVLGRLRLTTRATLPGRVEFAALPDLGASAGRLGAVFGLDPGGPVLIDLVDGPHALVVGTTGSGKSELLVSWVLAMARGRTPQQVSFLLVDFKGGSAFAPLTVLPHCVGVITDLDESAARRALQSLTAELRYRETRLAELAAASIEKAPYAFARLVVVVDEYAALVGAHPELGGLFADIAARGRSLGVHLLLCTQRPTGVVSDAVLANTGLRICLRVNNRADSVAAIGIPDAADLPATRLGRALIDGRPVHVAIAAQSDAEAVAAATPNGPAPRRPWCDPLPTDLRLPELPRPEHPLAPSAVTFGLADQPRQQRQVAAVYDPLRHGHLLVVGASGTGKSTLLRTLASHPLSRLVPPGVEAAWDAVSALARDPSGAAGLTLLDDLDSVAAQLTDDHLAAFVELLQRAARDGVGRLVLAARRVTAPVQSLLPLCDARLLLRLPDRHEHALVGGDSSAYDPRLPDGRCHWQGDLVQIARRTDLPAAPAQGDARFLPTPGRSYLVASTASRRCAAALAALGTHDVLALDPDAADPRTLGTGSAGSDGRGRILVADPDTWQNWWGALPALRGRADVIVDGCSTSQYRALTRDSDLPPPFAPGRRVSWLVDAAGPRRILLP